MLLSELEPDHEPTPGSINFVWEQAKKLRRENSAKLTLAPMDDESKGGIGRSEVRAPFSPTS